MPTIQTYRRHIYGGLMVPFNGRICPSKLRPGGPSRKQGRAPGVATVGGAALRARDEAKRQRARVKFVSYCKKKVQTCADIRCCMILLVKFGLFHLWHLCLNVSGIGWIFGFLMVFLSGRSRCRTPWALFVQAWIQRIVFARFFVHGCYIAVVAPPVTQEILWALDPCVSYQETMVLNWMADLEPGIGLLYYII